jgi:hypothetical protein
LEEKNTNTDLFIGIYRSFLRSGGRLEIDQIIQPYKKSIPFLHQKAGDSLFDVPAFIYASLRLPSIIHNVESIYLAQTESIFVREGIYLSSWEEEPASARRRKMYFDGKNKLCIYINSVTDVDDIVCLLTAYQIEWNKIHTLLKGVTNQEFKKIVDTLDSKRLQQICKIDIEDWQRLCNIYDSQLFGVFKKIRKYRIDFCIQHLQGSYVDYKKASSQWFKNIVEKSIYKNFFKKPIYFVSSNNHSIVNTITGYVNIKEAELVEFMYKFKNGKLAKYWESLSSQDVPGSKENFLWYINKKYEQVHPEEKAERVRFEQNLGVDYIEAKKILDVNVQLIKLAGLANLVYPQSLIRNLII